ncbi:MAG: arginine deiminase-related protein [Flavobacteriaceae bacterium]|nr:arginine deiminase-related protein [Flavobacteriaceae bacterium]
MQYTSNILMIRPASFRMNEETAVNNYFQSETQLDPRMVVGAAQREFDEFVALLRANGVNVIVVEDIKENDTPDALFPNNWISMHKEGKVGLYPMFAENRRRERREDILDVLEENGFEISEVIDYSSAEEEEVFLEGTGSLILDRENGIAYCALSDRADEELLIEFCEDFEYTPIIFGAYQSTDNKRLPIYHTNVMMCVADRFAVICLDSIDDKKERKAVKEQLKSNGKTIVAITEKQMHEFAGNMLQVKATNGPVLVMSDRAYRSLQPDQIKTLESFGPIIHPKLDIIETCGGGSARCMMAEIFLPQG